MTADIEIVEADDKNILDITSLFHRFFGEEGIFKYRSLEGIFAMTKAKTKKTTKFTTKYLDN